MPDASVRQELSQATVAGRLLGQWYAEHGRDFPWRAWKDRYRIVVTEMLLQRTQAERVAEFLPGFLGKHPSWDSLANSEFDELAADLRPLGLQNRRAQNLQSLAKAMSSSRTFLPEELEHLPGIGQYVGRAARIHTIGTTEAMVDANFVRVLKRYFGGEWKSDYRYDKRLQTLALAMVSGAPDSQVVNWAVLDLGALVCKPMTPNCAECPLTESCEFANRIPIG
jgi:A/G-specific adenine glycosylase